MSVKEWTEQQLKEYKGKSNTKPVYRDEFLESIFGASDEASEPPKKGPFSLEGLEKLEIPKFALSK